MGGLFHLPLIRTSARRLGVWLAQHDIPAIALCPQAQRLWTDLPRRRSCALLLGEERTGLSPTLRRLSDHEVKLPMPGRADSLNVAVAAGVVMYELSRGG
jgi:TrmH family RNA methyltransferase